VVLDLQMPHVDGRSLLRVLKENRRWRHVPVIAITATNPSVQSQAELIRLGAYTVARKPINRENLDPVIQRAMKDMMDTPVGDETNADELKAAAAAAASWRTAAVQRANGGGSNLAMTQLDHEDDVQRVLKQLELQQRVMVQNGTIERQRQSMGALRSAKHALMCEYAAGTGEIPQAMLLRQSGTTRTTVSNPLEMKTLEAKIDAVFDRCGGDVQIAGTRECNLCLK